jgi:catechol 2,3-dioxygenase-like lactoylglutathione lyase family enzyme
MVEIKWSWDFGLREVPLVAGTEEIKNGQNPRCSSLQSSGYGPGTKRKVLQRASRDENRAENSSHGLPQMRRRLLYLGKDTPVKYDSLEQTPVHHAFKVAAEDFEPAMEFLKQNGVKIFHVEDRRDGVFWGRQAYFLDPDGNKLEIHDPQGMGV